MDECAGQGYLGVEMVRVEPIIETNISCGRNGKYDILQPFAGMVVKCGGCTSAAGVSRASSFMS